MKTRDIYGMGWDDQYYQSPYLEELEESLKEEGLRIKFFTSHRDFRKAVEEKSKSGLIHQPAFFLLDAFEPGVDHSGPVERGRQLATFCRGLYPDLPIFFLSAQKLNIEDYTLQPSYIFLKRNPSEVAWLLRQYLKVLRLTGQRVFIGHGKHDEWKKVKGHLGKHEIPIHEFGIGVAGMTVSERLVEMKKDSHLAILVMTAEDEQLDGKLRARQNVIHEIGLFQGYLGTKRTIVFREEGVEPFSNNYGVVDILFKKNQLHLRFDELDKILEREGFTLSSF